MADDATVLLLSLEARTDKLEKSMAKARATTSKSLKAMEAEAEGSMLRLEALFGKVNVGEALENVFKRTRFAVFEEGAAKIPVFGSALEALGPAGLAAAAGLFAAFEGMEKVRQAAEEVGQLKTNADKLSIPVEDLQRWQFIAAQSHVSNEQLEESFEGLSVTLGKLKSGIRDQRIRPFLDELGISDGDIARAHNAADLMDLIISKMSKIQDPGERAQIADAFGMGSALPILSKTRAEIQGMSEDFSKNAHVISGEQAEAIERQNASLERSHALLHGEIRADLLELAPLVGNLGLAWDTVAAKALGAIAAMAQGLQHFEDTAGKMANYKPPANAGPGAQAAAFGENALGRFNTAITHPTTTALDLLGIGGADARWWNIGKPRDLFPAAPEPKGGERPEGHPDVGSGEATRGQMERAAKATDDLSKALAEYVTHTSHAAEMQKRIAEDRKNGATITPQQEQQLMGAARAQDAKSGEGAAKKAEAAAKKALEETKASDDAISSAKKDELRARVALTADLLADHRLKLQELAETRDTKNRQAQQDAQAGKIGRSAAATVIGANNGAYQAGVDLENRRFAETIADQARTYSAELARYEAAHLTAQAEIATTAEAWAADTKAAFAKQKAADRAEFIDKTNKRVTELGANHLDPDQARALIAGYDAQQADETAKNTRDTDLEVLSRKRAFADQLQGYVTSSLEAEASMAATAAQRRTIEQRILALRQQQEREALEDQIKKDHLSAEDASKARAGLASQQSAQTSQSAYDNAGPLQAWAQAASKASTDVGEAFQTEAVKGIEGFNSALANSMVNAKNFGQLFQSVIKSIESDLIELILKQAEVGVLGSAGGLASGLFGSNAPQATAAAAGTNGGLLGSLISMLPHFAAGTDDAPGGLSLVGEKGPELVNLPGGAGVTPNNVLSSIGRLDPSKFTGGQTTMNHNITVDVTGANGDEAIRQIAHEAAAAGTLQAISYSNSKLKNLQRAPGRDLTRF